MGELLERFERVSEEMASPLIEAAAPIVPVDSEGVVTPLVSPHAMAAAYRSRHPIGHHKHRYGPFVLGVGLILAAIMLMLNMPFWQILLVLGVLILIGATIAHHKEG